MSLLDDQRLKPIQAFKDIFEKYDKKSERIPHEVMSCIFFSRIWSDVGKVGDEWVPQAVTAAILGGEAIDRLDSELQPWIALSHDLVSSAPADADRMDYLERDSRSCGVSYGLFDRNRLLKSMLCYRDGTETQRRYRLGIKVSGYRAIENFVQARFELFVQVYYHKTNRAIESMLEEIARIAKNEEDIKIVPEESLEELIDGYVNLSDEYFLDVLRGRQRAGLESVANKDIRSLAECIHNRKLWKRVFDLQDYGTSKDERQVDRLYSELRASFEGDLFHEDKVPPRATKDLDEGAAILSEVDGIYTANPELKWEGRSPLIKALGEGEKLVYRIFAKSDSPDEVKRYRKRVRELWKRA
jgi:uncharacterized protein